MNDEQNNFYTSISGYYHEIFPFNPAQLKFVERNTMGLTGKKILDIGCATGELAYRLAMEGAEVTGIDLNEALLDRAKKGKKHRGLTFQKGDMLELEKDFQKEMFDAVLCFGNTLVHLSSPSLVEKMLKGVRYVLKPGAVFMLQILSYDYIIANNINELPEIDTENIRFVRRYGIGEAHPLIRFHTRLFLKKEGKLIENETLLLPLKSAELRLLLANAGFNKTEFYSGFMEEPLGGFHLPLVGKSYSGSINK